MAATPDGGGYWLVASDGGVFSFGDAGFHGSTGAMPLNKPMVGMAATPDGGGTGWWPPTAGSSPSATPSFHGSTGAMPLNKPIVGMAATPDGGGYWLVASDGGVFSFGDAELPRIGRCPGPQQAHRGHGRHPRRRRVLAGGLRRRGVRLRRRQFLRLPSRSGHREHQPIVGMAATPDGGGYWIVGQDGALYSYGDANYLGSLVGAGLAAPIVATARS